MEYKANAYTAVHLTKSQSNSGNRKYSHILVILLIFFNELVAVLKYGFVKTSSDF